MNIVFRKMNNFGVSRSTYNKKLVLPSAPSLSHARLQTELIFYHTILAKLLVTGSSIGSNFSYFFIFTGFIYFTIFFQKNLYRTKTSKDKMNSKVLIYRCHSNFVKGFLGLASPFLNLSQLQRQNSFLNGYRNRFDKTFLKLFGLSCLRSLSPASCVCWLSEKLFVLKSSAFDMADISEWVSSFYSSALIVILLFIVCNLSTEPVSLVLSSLLCLLTESSSLIDLIVSSSSSSWFESNT